jgi:hypothetical protein
MKSHWRMLVLVAAVLLCAGMAQTTQGHVLLADVGLYETPAVYSELEFSQPAALPNTLKEPGGDVEVSFGIHNVSNDARTYQWSILVAHAGKSQVKASGAAPIPAQGRTSIARSVVAECASGQTQVVVRLATPAESISFWMTCVPAKKAKQ